MADGGILVSSLKFFSLNFDKGYEVLLLSRLKFFNAAS